MHEGVQFPLAASSTKNSTRVCENALLLQITLNPVQCLGTACGGIMQYLKALEQGAQKGAEGAGGGRARVAIAEMEEWDTGGA